MRIRHSGGFAFLLVAGLWVSCTTEHKITHVVQPVQITVDVNVQVREELNDFFGELDAASETVEYNEPENTNET